MATTRSVPARLAAVALLAVASCVPAAVPQDPAQQQRIAALHAAGLAAPMVLHPVQVLGRPDERVALALGLVLERQGMSALDTAAQPFAPTAEASWDEVQAQFAAQVRANDAAAGHHLYAQFLGTPQTGPEEVRFVVVDGEGAIVLADRQKPADRAFRRTAGRDPDPLGCSTLVAERLFELADWTARSGSVAEGRFTQIWRGLSGAPEPAEFAAMDERRAALRDGIASARFAVLPSVVTGRHDGDSASRLAAALAERFGCRAVAVPDGARIAVRPDSNEQRRLWDLARGVRAAAPALAGRADHVIAVDLAVGEDAVAWVHIAICTAAGEFVVADWQNDQHPMLQRAAPRSLADAERFAVDRLAALLR